MRRGASTKSQVSPWPLGSAAPQEVQPHHSASCRDVGERDKGGGGQKALGWLRLFWLPLGARGE